MKKQIFVLTHDYWHHSDTIEPMIDLLFDDSFDVTFTTDPAEYLKHSPDLFVTFKDPIENDQIPTPVWCTDEWTAKFLEDVKAGMGVLGLHAALTDLPKEHPIVTEIIRSLFLTHPRQCPLTFTPVAEHPLFDGVEDFTFPGNDEHYVMEFLPNAKTTLLANTQSVNGVQPGMWIHELGEGRICCITPGHTTQNLTCAPFLKLVGNAAAWCMKK